ncbi:MAG: DUF2848 domain-containing protein [Pseudomonadota bacterium]
MHTLEFQVSRASVRRQISTTARKLVIAGWTGRDSKARDQHIKELERIGVPQPRTTPVFYSLATNLLSQGDVIEVVGQASSGEAEAVVFSYDGALWVTVGSDHTDRRLEAVSISASKQLCAKPIGREVWPLNEVVGHWDELILSSYVWAGRSRERYQRGVLGENLSAIELIDLYNSEVAFEDGSMMFCGTFPIIGNIRGGTRFDIEMEDPVTHQFLRHSYYIRELPLDEPPFDINGTTGNG